MAGWDSVLAIARHLTELHGGTIEVESAGEHQGAKFTVKLPLMSEWGSERLIGEVVRFPSAAHPSKPPLPSLRLRCKD